MFKRTLLAIRPIASRRTMSTKSESKIESSAILKLFVGTSMFAASIGVAATIIPFRAIADAINELDSSIKRCLDGPRLERLPNNEPFDLEYYKSLELQAIRKYNEREARAAAERKE